MSREAGGGGVRECIGGLGGGGCMLVTKYSFAELKGKLLHVIFYSVPLCRSLNVVFVILIFCMQDCVCTR